MDEKKVPAIEISYLIDYTELKKIYNGVLYSYLNDDKSINILKELGNTDDITVKNNIEELRNSLTDTVIDGDLNVLFTVDAISSKFLELSFKDNSSSVVFQSLDDEVKVEINGDNTSINITVDKKENKFFADFKNEDDEAARFSITGKVDEISDLKRKCAVSFTIYDSEDINKESFSISTEFENDVNSSITSIDPSNAISIDEMNGTDLELITSLMMGENTMIYDEEYE